MLKIVQYFIWLIVNIGLTFFAINTCLTPKSKKWYFRFGIPIVILIYSYFIIYFFPDVSLARITLAVTQISYVLLCFKEKLLTKLFTYTITIMLGLGVECIVHICEGLIGRKLADPAIPNIDTLVVLSIYNFLVFIAYTIFTYFYTKRREKIYNKTMILFILVPFSQYFVCAGACYKAFTDVKGFYEFVDLNLLNLGFIISCVADVLLFTAIRTNNKAELNKRKIAQLEYNQALALNYYEVIKKNAETLMKYKHDFNNMLSTAYQLIQSDDEKSKSDGIKLLNQIRDKNKATVIPVYSENSVVNAILFDKTNYAEEHGVVIDCETKVPSEISIELTDLCSIISNLLDNAIKSAEKSHNNKVELNAWCDMGYLFVRVRNFPDDITELKTNKNHLDKSIKADAHGYGMDILSDIAEKYDGKMDFDYDDNVVSAVCSVKVSQ